MSETQQQIKHLVISGGGITIFKLIGCLDVLFKVNYFSMKQIQSIYGTSAGAIIGTVLALQYDWPVVTDYFIKRPWKDVLSINIQSILEAYNKRGLFDKKMLELIFKPLFDAKDISLQITMKEFYDHTHIDLHFFTLEINGYQIEDISHSTHPDLSLITAVQMTACLPILLSPVLLDNKCYVDAGYIVNYPLHYCIEKYKDPDSILGFKNEYQDIQQSNTSNDINSDSTLFEYLVQLMYKIVWNVSTESKQPTIKHELLLKRIQPNTIAVIQKAIQEEQERSLLFDDGKLSAIDFLSSHKPKHQQDKETTHDSDNPDSIFVTMVDKK